MGPSKPRAVTGEKVRITCPICSHVQYLAVPAGLCQTFYVDKGGCEARIMGRNGRCVFCSYGAKECDTGC